MAFLLARSVDDERTDMREKDLTTLRHIKDRLMEGTYSILQPNQWDKDSRDLASCGASLLQDIESQRDHIREFEVPLLAFKAKAEISQLTSDYEHLAKKSDLYFDASMRWLKCIINKNEYKEYQILQRKYVEQLTAHCFQSLDHLGHLVRSRKNEYHHYQVTCLSTLAILVAVFAIVVGVLS